MTNYVVGFLFSPSMGQLVLVQKQRPQWQAGRFNGVGGHVEEGETFHGAMVREFREETGKEVLQWTRYCTLNCEHAIVVFYYAVAEDFNKVETTTDEEIMLWDVDYVMELDRDEILPNLRWLIPMAQSFFKGESAEEFVVTEVGGDPNKVALTLPPVIPKPFITQLKTLFKVWFKF